MREGNPNNQFNATQVNFDNAKENIVLEDQIAKEKVINPENLIKEGVDFVFKTNPELALVGSKEQYLEYLDTIFPDSKFKDIVYHGTNKKFEEFDPKFLGTNAYVGPMRNYFHFTTSRREAWQYIDTDTSFNELLSSDLFNLKELIIRSKKDIDAVVKKMMQSHNPICWDDFLFELDKNGQIINYEFLDQQDFTSSLYRIQNTKQAEEIKKMKPFEKMKLNLKSNTYHSNGTEKEFNFIKIPKNDFNIYDFIKINENGKKSVLLSSVINTKNPLEINKEEEKSLKEKDKKIFTDFVYDLERKNLSEYDSIILYNTSNYIRRIESKGMFVDEDEYEVDLFLNEMNASETYVNNHTSVLVRDSENIHILGSKKDIREFKQFVQ